MQQICFSLGLAICLGCSPLLKSPGERPPKKVTFHPYCFPNLDLCVSVTPTTVPIPVDQMTLFKLKFWNISTGSAEGPYVDPGMNPKLWLWMSMPTGSHGSPTDIEVIRTGVGEYDADFVFFSMAGEWQLILKLENGRSASDELVQFIWI